MALSINSSTGVTLASWGNSTSPKFRGLEVLSPQDSLRSSTHKGFTRVTHTTLRNSASVELQGKKSCLYKTPYVPAPIRVPRWCHCEFYALHVTSYRHTYKSQKFSFLVHEWCVLEETHLIISRLLCKFLRGDLQAKVVPETDYLLRFWRSPTRVPQASLQADSALTRCQEQKPQDPRRTRWLQEKGRWAISPDSRASHPLHSYAVGYYSQSK